jgi:hypothetical protein
MPCSASVANKVKPEMVMRLLGLTRTADTVVGDASVRGVSGGERKRVTTGEVLVGSQVSGYKPYPQP